MATETVLFYTEDIVWCFKCFMIFYDNVPQKILFVEFWLWGLLTRSHKFCFILVESVIGQYSWNLLRLWGSSSLDWHGYSHTLTIGWVQMLYVDICCRFQGTTLQCIESRPCGINTECTQVFPLSTSPVSSIQYRQAEDNHDNCAETQHGCSLLGICHPDGGGGDVGIAVADLQTTWKNGVSP